MKTFTRIIGVLVLGFGLVGVASAAFTLPGTETYVGYIGNLDIGRLDGSGGTNPEIGTDWISSPGEQNNTFVGNSGDQFDPWTSGAGAYVETTHWYKFALNDAALLEDFVEIGNWADAEISFFHEDATFGDSAFVTVTRNDPHDFQSTSLLLFDAGSWWMKIVGKAYDSDDINYTVRLSTQPVPLPPAILLFVSALAGFGVMGRKKKQLAS